MKRIILFYIIVVLTFCTNLAFGFPGSGQGTLADPYQITNNTLLEAVNLDLAAHYILMNDIDLTPVVTGDPNYTNSVIAFDTDNSSILFDGEFFSGSFDGDTHKIIGLTIDGNDKGYIGLFGQIVGAEIKNLVIENCKVTGDVYSSALVGENNGRIFNCRISGSVKGISDYVGAVAGINNKFVFNCHSNADVTGTRKCVGGLIGKNGFNGSMMNCSYQGNVIGIQSVGGLVGYHRTGFITNCYASGRATGNSYVGGLVGLMAYDTIANCYAAIDVSGTSMAHGLIGKRDSQKTADENCFWDMDVQTHGVTVGAGGTGLTTDQMQMQSYFTDAGWDFVGENSNGTSGIWEMSAISGYPEIADISVQLAGDGTDANPYLINDCNDLGAMIHYDWRSSYKLQNDIDMAGIRWSSAVTPIFNGSFDGNGHEISGLNIGAGSSDYIALFGQAHIDSEIKNLSVINCNINGYESVAAIAGSNWGSITNCDASGYVSGEDYVAILAAGNSGLITNCHAVGEVNAHNGVALLTGINGGTITNCYADGVIRGNWNVAILVGSNGHQITNCYALGSVKSGGRYIGGLIGSNASDSSVVTNSHAAVDVGGGEKVGGLAGYNEGTIENCYATGDIFSFSEFIGGLVGQNSGDLALIRKCYATGDAFSHWYVGGLAGNNSGTIENCYATGDVSGNYNYIGGLVAINSGTITKCYSTGDVRGPRCTGGSIGTNSGTITHCFWNTEVQSHGITVGVGCGQVGGVEGKEPAVMQTLLTFTIEDWDFASTWWINDGRNYPKLSWQPFGDLNNDSYVNLKDLAFMAKAWGANDGEVNYNSVCELSGDTLIGIADLAVFADNWLDGPFSF